MKHFITIAIIFILSNRALAADWISFSSERDGQELTSCGKDKAPGEYMKIYDEMFIQYKISDEVKDKSGVIQSLVLTKSPGNISETVMFFFKSSKACETEFKKRSAIKDKLIEESKKKEDKKYDSYN